MKSKLKEKLNLKSEGLIPKSSVTELKDKPKRKKKKLHQKTEQHGENRPRNGASSKFSYENFSNSVFCMCAFNIWKIVLI